jgi:hypothetical protein
MKFLALSRRAQGVTDEQVAEHAAPEALTAFHAGPPWCT